MAKNDLSDETYTKMANKCISDFMVIVFLLALAIIPRFDPLYLLHRVVRNRFLHLFFLIFGPLEPKHPETIYPRYVLDLQGY